MSKPSVSIELARGPWADDGSEYERSWPVGGRVKGRVSISAPVATKTRKITIDLTWKTEGRGNPDKKSVDSVTIHEGELYDGAMINHDFELTLPEDGPITYDGHYIRIVWTVVVRIDIPWAKDVFERADFTVLPQYADARR